MDTLTPSAAVALVRKNLEELDPNSSIMYEDENGSAVAYGDNRSLDSIIERNLPEAINAVHLAAPVQLLDGVEHTFTREDVAISDDGILTICLGSDKQFLRLVAFQAEDSNIVVTDVLAEASPEGRKQLNPYIRGRADRPRLVLMQATHDAPKLVYYTLTTPSQWLEPIDPEHPDEPSLPLPTPPDPVPQGYSWKPDAVKQLSYIQKQFYASDSNGYPISRMVRRNIIDYLTAMVLETYSDQRAQTFYTKAASF